MSDVITQFQSLDNAQMDATHREFVALVNAATQAGKADFADIFQRLLVHTEQHFNAEQQAMEASGFPALHEHRAEHARVLRDMRALVSKVAQGQTVFARAYVKNQLPGWFELHLQTMDAALALHLKLCEEISV